MKAFAYAVLLATAVGGAVAPASACTRVVYLGENQDVITARSMDWQSDIATNLWVLPRGIARNGQAGRDSIHWKA